MKISLTTLLANMACLYSSACVIYQLSTHDLPEVFYYPLFPGIWVGALVHNQIGEKLMLCYAAGIGTMTVVGGALGALFDRLAEKPSTTNAPP